MLKTVHFDLSVLMTADTAGGVWTYALELARHLADRGVQVSLATMGAPASEEQRRQADDIPGLCLFESPFKLEWMEDPWDDVKRAGEWLLDLERRFTPDVIHLNGYCHGALPWSAPIVMVGHSCVLSWWEAVKRAPPPERFGRYRDEVVRGIRAAARLAAPTRAMLAALSRHYGAHPWARVIRNGHDPMSFVMSEKQPIVLCATRAWDEAKNVATLAQAASGLVWPVFVAGGTTSPCGREIERSSDVLWLGKLERPDVLRWLSRAAIFALPARYEPFGLSALEAACAGAALVLGDIPSLREIWGDTAVFVPPDDAAGLRRAITALAVDSRRRKDLAERGRRRGLRLSAGRMAEQYRRIYVELASRRTTRRVWADLGERTL